MSKQDNKKDRVEEGVLKTLQILDTLEKVDVGPFFFARLQARLAGSPETSEPWLVKFLFGGRGAPALLAVVVVFNVLTVVTVFRGERENQTVLRDQNVETLADDYRLTGTSTSLDVGAE